MVFIHGGGYIAGSSAQLMYGPDLMMQKDVVLVTFNYRLGALGKVVYTVVVVISIIINSKVF